MVNVVPLPVVWAQECLYMTLCGLDGVDMRCSTLINKGNAVIDGAVRVTLCIKFPVRCTAIADDRSAGFNPCIYKGLQSVSGSVRNGNETRFIVLALNTAKHPLPLNRVAPLIFAGTELALVDLDGLVRTTDPRTAALYVHQHGFSAELAPVSDRIVTEAMLSLDKVGTYSAHEVCEKHNLLESEVTLLKP